MTPVTRGTLDTAIAVSQLNDDIPFEVWLHAVSFIVEKPYHPHYIILNNLVIYVTPTVRRLTPIRLFKNKGLQIQRKTFGSMLQDSIIAHDLLEGRKTIEEVLRL